MSAITYPIDVRALQTRLFGSSEVPDSEQWRMYYGSGVSPARIESVIRSAQLGFMRDLTDLAYETVAIDPHLGSILGKRFRAIAALDFDVTAASGPGVEPEPASEVADMVRQAFARIDNMSDAVLALDWGHFDGRSAIEKQWVYDPTDSIQWSISELSWIHPRRLTYGPERELRLNDDAWQGGSFEARGFDLRSIPFKWTQFKPRLFNDYPEREGLAPRCLYFSLFKRFSWRERLILLEVFGKPWRIVWVPDPDKTIVQDDQLAEAQASVDQMASNATGALPPGIALQTDQPHPDSGNLHRDIAQEADDQNSLLVLGNKRTSDSKPGALGSSAEEVAKIEQTEVTLADARNISAVFTTIAREIVTLNLGAGALRYMPKVRFALEPTPDRAKDTDRANKAMELGVPFKLTEIYEITGFEQPEPGDEVVQIVSSGGTDAMGNPTNTRAPKIGVMGDGGGIDEPPPPAMPPATPPPSPPAEPPATDDDVEQVATMTADDEPSSYEVASALAAKMTELGIARCEHGKINRCQLCGIERVRDVEMVNGEVVWKVQWRAIPKPISFSASKNVDKPVLALVAGIPASGKSTFAKTKLSSMKRINRDDHGDRSSQMRTFESAIEAGDNCVVDDTLVTREIRASFIGPAKDAGYEIVGYQMENDPEACLVRNGKREAKVPPVAIHKALKSWEPLEEGEGFSKILDVSINDDGGYTITKRETAPARGTAARPFDHRICCARDPDSVFGSPDTMVERGVPKSARITAGWGRKLESAVSGLDTAGDIRRALNTTGLDLQSFADVVEREVMRAVMLGALDSAWERENDEDVKLETFARITMAAAETNPKFVEQPYETAVKFFRAKQVLTKAAFERLTARAKKRAFTVARLASMELIGAVKSELDNQLRSASVDLRQFKTFMRSRIESAGWTPANSSHVELIYRVNTMQAYNAGRKSEMSQPSVKKLRPYWQIQGVKDDRIRETHRAAIGTVLPADDPFWDRAYPPFGFSCRCRIVSRSQAWVDRMGVAIGPAPTGLPDEGWEGGGKL